MKNIIVLIALVFSVVWSQSASARAHDLRKKHPTTVGKKYNSKSKAPHAAVYKASPKKRSVSSTHSKKSKVKKSTSKARLHAKKKRH